MASIWTGGFQCQLVGSDHGTFSTYVSIKKMIQANSNSRMASAMNDDHTPFSHAVLLCPDSMSDHSSGYSFAEQQSTKQSEGPHDRCRITRKRQANETERGG